MHKLLARQIKKIYGDSSALPLQAEPLIEVVDTAYRQSDLDRKLLERSLDLTSTELLEANAELRRDQAALAMRYRALAEQLPIGVFEADAKGRTTYVNPEWARITGRARESLLGDDWARAIHPDDQERVQAGWRAAVREQRGVRDEEYRVLPLEEDRLVWVVGSAEPVFDQDGRLQGYVGALVDITERRSAEEAVRRSEAKYRALFEGSRDAIYISTPEGRLLDINPAGVELFGYDDKAQMLRLDVGVLYRRPQERESLLAVLHEVGYVRDHEIQAVRKDGSTRVLLATVSLVRDAEGAPVAMRGILRDVTAQRAMERELAESRKMEAIGRLAGGVAHDFNNLLTAIIGYGDLLARDSSTDDQRRRYAQEVVSAARRGAALTDQLLAFSRRKTMQRRAFDLNALVLELQSMLQRMIGDDVELTTHLDPEAGAVRGDPARIEQVLINLVVNARDAMPDGGRVELRTHAASEDQPGVVGLSVRDTGVGIPERDRERIFEPFFSTKGGAGTGLGLSIVYGIVEQSGGRISVDSTLGSGTTFSVSLPRAVPAASADRHTAPSRSPARRADAHGRILLAEDEATVRSFVAELLRGEGFELIVAPDGLSALEAAAEVGDRFDLLLTDVVMPRLSGVALARRLRERRPFLPVLYISGDVDRSRELLEDELRRADVRFLSKPFSAEELLASVLKMLRPGPGPGRLADEARRSESEVGRG
jgi:PAS domain S-box-containing protein